MRIRDIEAVSCHYDLDERAFQEANTKRDLVVAACVSTWSGEVPTDIEQIILLFSFIIENGFHLTKTLEESRFYFWWWKTRGLTHAPIGFEGYVYFQKIQGKVSLHLHKNGH